MIIVKTENGCKQVSHSVLKSNFNNFKGWKCYAGKDFLSISQNGDIFGNVCRHSKKYGNVYKEFSLPASPIICPATSCYCASDLEIPKENNNNSLQEIKHSYFYPVVDNLSSASSLIGDKKFGPDKYFSINWNIGRRCNYDCSYCPSTVHDNFSPHVDLEKFKKAFKNLYEKINSQKVKLTFTGGEPTINPNYFDMIEYCMQFDGVSVYTNTNGTANKDKLLSLCYAGGVYLSVHLEYADLHKLKQKIKFVANNKLTKNHFVVKLMLQPNFNKDVISFIEDIKQFEDKENFYVSVEPLVDKLNDNKRYNYSEKELAFIRTKEWN